ARHALVAMVAVDEQEVDRPPADRLLDACTRLLCLRVAEDQLDTLTRTGERPVEPGAPGRIAAAELAVVQVDGDEQRVRMRRASKKVERAAGARADLHHDPRPPLLQQLEQAAD